MISSLCISQRDIVHKVIGEDRLKPVLYVACLSRRMHADNEMIHFIIYWRGEYSYICVHRLYKQSISK